MNEWWWPRLRSWRYFCLIDNNIFLASKIPFSSIVRSNSMHVSRLPTKHENSEMISLNTCWEKSSTLIPKPTFFKYLFTENYNYFFNLFMSSDVATRIPVMTLNRMWSVRIFEWCFLIVKCQWHKNFTMLGITPPICSGNPTDIASMTFKSSYKKWWLNRSWFMVQASLWIPAFRLLKLLSRNTFFGYIKVPILDLIFETLI